MSWPVDPARRCLRLREWPAGDRLAWEIATTGSILDDTVAALACLRPRTLKTYADCYGRWLTFLRGRTGLDEDLPPALRVTPARITAYVDELRQAGSSSATLAHRIVGLHLALRALAPGHDWAWLGRLATRLRRQVRSTRAKHLLVRSSCEPAAAGVAMMAEAEAAIGQRPAARATAYRDGLMLALLAARPVRAGNFAAIRIGHHLRRVGAGWWLTFEPGETKAGTAIELPLPADLVGRLEAYLERWRPVLLGGGDSDRLWISGRGRPLSYDTVYYRIRVATRRRLGRAMNPHLLRDCLATSIAIADPANIGMAAAILGHATLATTQKYYNSARQGEAAELWQANLRELRRRAGSPPGRDDGTGRTTRAGTRPPVPSDGHTQLALPMDADLPHAVSSFDDEP